MMYVYSFYKFHKLGNLSSLKEEILRYMNKYSIKGTILLSHEGINVNISQEKYLLDLSIKDMNESINLTNVFINKTKSKEIAFQKIKVKIKNEIIRFNCSINNYSKQKKHLKSITK